VRLLRVLGYVLLVVLTGLVAVRWAGLDRWTPLIQAMVFVPYLAAVALVVLLMLFFTHRRRLAVWALLVFIAYFAALLPRWAVPDHGTPKGSHLRIMTANLHDGGADATALVRRIKQQRPDILAVQELTPGEATALDRAGIGQYLPSRVLRPGPKAIGSGLYSRGELTDGRGLSPHSTFNMARATMPLGNASLDLVSVHPRPPMTAGSARDWNRDLDLLPHTTAPGIQVLVGDFNGTEDMYGFRRLTHDGYHDAAITVGSGLRPTWYGWPIPPATFDHVLTEKRLTATAVHTYGLPGSDHHILVADLVLT
jgi:endonuclease/exonuclease/phosphatase (EEP) superfamily protein YafD